MPNAKCKILRNISFCKYDSIMEIFLEVCFYIDEQLKVCYRFLYGKYLKACFSFKINKYFINLIKYKKNQTISYAFVIEVGRFNWII